MIIPTVDEQDKLIEYKEKSQVKDSDVYRVSALWLTNSKGEVLLAKRVHTKKHDPSKWGPAVAGTVEKGETYESNIIKETEEEIGLTNVKFKLGAKQRIHGKHNFFDQWFLATVDMNANDFVIQKEEVEEVRWFSKKEIKAIFKKNPDFFIASAKQWIDLFV